MSPDRAWMPRATVLRPSPAIRSGRGSRTSLRKRDGRTLTFTYDALNRMTSKVVPGVHAPVQIGACTPGSATRDVYYGYDLRGLQTYARFDSATGEGVATAYTGFGEVASTTTTMGGVTRTVGSQYEAGGNRVFLTHADGTCCDGCSRQRSRVAWSRGWWAAKGSRSTPA